MVPKDKGWGMSNLGLWGKNPCVATFLCFSIFLVSPNLFNVLFWVVEAVMTAGGWRQSLSLGVGWQDCQSLAHMPTPPTTSFTPPSHISNFHDYGLLLSCLVFNLHDGGLLIPPLEGLLIRAHRRSCFSSRAGWDPHAERRSALSSRTGSLRWFFLAQGMGQIVAVTQDFRV